MPSASAAVELMVTFVGNVNNAPFAGEEILTVGGKLFTTLIITEVVEAAPALSVARARIVCEPVAVGV